MSVTSLTESESSAFSSSNSSFRLSICLQSYFSDIRSQCYILITRKRRMKTIKWLEKRLKKMFQIPGRFYLKTKGHFLPSSERMALLNPDDRVEVIPQKLQNEKDQHEGNKSIANIDYNKINGEDVPDTSIRQKRQLTSVFNIMEKNNDNNGRIADQNEIQNENLAHEQILEICQLQQTESNSFADQYHQYTLQSNCQKETQDESQVLEQLKKHALALLDENYDKTEDKNDESTDTFNNTCNSRKRRRVRRRPRRTNTLVSEIKHVNQNESTIKSYNLVSPTCFDNVSLNNAGKDYPDASSIGPKEIFSDDSNSLSTISSLVTRNESIYVRKPRIVQSLVEIKS